MSLSISAIFKSDEYEKWLLIFISDIFFMHKPACFLNLIYLTNFPCVQGLSTQIKLL